MEKKRRFISLKKNLNRQVILLFLLSFWACPGVYAQEADKPFVPSRKLSDQLFGKGEYEKALPHFEALAAMYPADPVYKYYSALCLINLERNPARASSLLEEAVNYSGTIRKVPDDAIFYLGRAYQQSGLFEKAIACYERFRENVRSKVWRQYDVERFISECGKAVGKLVVSKDEQEKDTIKVLDGLAEKTDTILVKAEEARGVLADSLAELNKERDRQERDITGDSGYDQLARKALDLQFRADSVSRLADRYRETIKKLSGSDRQAVSNKIIEIETLYFRYQGEADRAFAELAMYNRTAEETHEEAQDAEPSEIVTDTLPAKVEPDSLKSVLTSKDSTLAEKPGLQEIIAPQPVLAIFDHSYRQTDKIPVNDTLPEGLFYRIQVAAFRNPVNPVYFKSFGPVFGLRSSGSDITFYNIGMFRIRKDAEKALLKVREGGFKDAFIIPAYEGRRISNEKADALENEWAGRSLLKDDLRHQKKQSEPETLVFRVVAGISAKGFTAGEIQNLENLAAGREYLVVENEDGSNVFLIGKFLTFESAISFSDLLYRNGVEDARVAAYLGKKEIPVDKARELFDFKK